jgi:phosphate-selective porin OprO/OprP
MLHSSCRTIIAGLLLLAIPVIGFSQQDTTLPKQTDSLKVLPDGTDGMFHTVHPKDTIAEKLPANEFNGRYTTFKIGLGYIHDFATYAQSDVFKKQMDSAGLKLTPQGKPRDFRVLGSGVLATKRYIAFKFAYMFDGDKNTWLVRESGITIGVPELAGHIFIGRTKEGFSMVKVMNGHSPWTQERQMALDVIPILADGIKWFGYLPKSKLFWNLGAYNDIFSKGQGFSTFEWQYVARVGWLPINDTKANKTLHIATNLRYGKPNNGEITLKSRPESNPAPQIINTGIIQADHSSHIGAEIYYRNKNFMIGSEMVTHNFYADSPGNHHFFGGDVVISYFFTGGVRPYKTEGSIFGFVPVKKSVFKGGLGEIEGVIRFSSLNLNDGSVQGGHFWRITPMVNWYISKVMRLEFVYGYGVLDRFGMKGNVQFFESRIQFTVM